MNKLLWSCAALLAVFVTAESLLTCHTCDVNILGTCLIGSHVNCTGDQNRCYTGVAKFSADLLDIHAKGCIKESQCQPNVTRGSILTVNYTITTRCCDTSLCNGASSVPLPLTAGLAAALLALWSQWAL